MRRIAGVARRTPESVKPLVKTALKMLGPRAYLSAMVAAGKYDLVELNGLRMYARWGRRRFMESFYDPLMAQTFQSILRPGMTVLDIGANVGYYTLLATRMVAPGGKIYAFEPSPEEFIVLRHNIRMNQYQNVHTIDKAVTDRGGTAYFYLSDRIAGNALTPHPLGQTVGACTVELISIDEFLGGRPVDVVKVDIEGNEPRAIRGMAETIRISQHLHMFIEFNPICLKKSGFQPDEFLEMLRGNGFSVSLIDEESQLLYPLADNRIPGIDNPLWYANLYCKK